MNPRSRNLNETLSRLARLQILEGSLGELGRWTQEGDLTEGFRNAQRALQESVHPNWFLEGDHLILYCRVQLAEILDEEGQTDLILDGLYKNSLFHAVGARLKDRIFSGKPLGVYEYNLLARWLYRRAQNRIRKADLDAHLRVDLQTDELQDIPEDPVEDSPARILEALYQMYDDPMGEELRRLFQRTLSGMIQEKATLMWLSAAGWGSKLSRTEIARRCGLTAAGVTARIQVGLAACHKALAADQDLRRRLGDYIGQAVEVSDSTDMFINYTYVGPKRYARL